MTPESRRLLKMALNALTMAISDTYVVQYLLQATRAGKETILWEEKESDGYAANLRGIRVELDRASSSTHSQLYLTLSHVSEKVHIAEPLSTGLFRERFQTGDDRHLALLMKELVVAIARQCAARKIARLEGSEFVREGIYRRLVGTSGVEV
jgi:hypothetical protein